MEFTRNWLFTCALTLAVVGCSNDDKDADNEVGAAGASGVAGSASSSGGRSNAQPVTGGQTPVATGGVSTAGKGIGGALNLAGAGANPGSAGAPLQPVAGNGSGHAGEGPQAAAGSHHASGGASSVGGAKAVAGAAGHVAAAGCGRVRYSNVDPTGATADAVQDVLDTLEARLLVCNKQEFARDDNSAAQFTLRVVVDEDGVATTTLRNRADASDAFFDCIIPIYRSADWSGLRRLEEVSATVRFRTGDC